MATSEEVRAMTTQAEVEEAIRRATRRNEKLHAKRQASFDANDWWLERLGDRLPELKGIFLEIHAEAEAEVERNYRERSAPTRELTERLDELSGPKTTIDGDED